MERITGRNGCGRPVENAGLERLRGNYLEGESMAEHLGERASQMAEEAQSRAREFGQAATEQYQKASRGVGRGEHREGQVTRAIEHYTSQIPSGGYLTVALGAMAASAILRAIDRRDDANFIGQWVPTLLIMGLYNKIVRLQGSE